MLGSDANRYQISEEILGMLLLSMIAIVTLIILLSHLSLLKLFKGFCILAILSSIYMTFVHECLLAEAEYKATIADAPKECFQDFDKDGYFIHIWYKVVKSFRGDHCRQHHMAILMQPYSIFKTTLLKAVRITFADFFFMPLETLGTALGKFFQNAFSELSYSLWIPAILILVVFAIAVAFALSLLCYRMLTEFRPRLFHTPANPQADDNWVEATPVVEHRGRGHRCCCANQVDALEDRVRDDQFPPMGLVVARNREINYELELEMRKRICYWERNLTMPDLVKRPLSPQNDDPNHNLSFIEEGLATVVQFISSSESKERTVNLINLTKEAVKDLKRLGVENFGITYQDVSTKLDLMDACSSTLGAHFSSPETPMIPALVLADINDSIRKLRTNIQH